MPKLSAHYLSPLCCIVLLIFGFTSPCLAQEASNKRGFQPGNSFAIGDFETINTTNGNRRFETLYINDRNIRARYGGITGSFRP